MTRFRAFSSVSVGDSVRVKCTCWAVDRDLDAEQEFRHSLNASPACQADFPGFGTLSRN